MSTKISLFNPNLVHNHKQEWLEIENKCNVECPVKPIEESSKFVET